MRRGCHASAHAMPTYPGRLLLVSGDHSTTSSEATSGVTLLQLTAGSRDPVEVGTAPLQEGVGVCTASADGTQLVGCDGTLAVVGTGIADYLPRAFGSFYGYASFSPDGEWLAYTLGDGKVVVYDLVAKIDRVVLQTPCASYTRRRAALRQRGSRVLDRPDDAVGVALPWRDARGLAGQHARRGRQHRVNRHLDRRDRRQRPPRWFASCVPARQHDLD